MPPPPRKRPSFLQRLKRAPAGFWEGAKIPMEGYRYLRQHKELWHYAIVPTLINFAITAFLLAMFLTAGYFLLSWIHHLPYFAGSIWGRMQETVLDFMLVTTALVSLITLYLLLGSFLSSTFYELLAHKVELQLGTPPNQLHTITITSQILDRVYYFVIVAIAFALSLSLECVPYVGLIIAILFSVYVDCWVFGYNFLEIPMALRKIPRKEKRSFARRHRPQVLGLGLTSSFMNFIPILGSIFMTTSAVGAVLLYKRLCDRDAAALLPSSPHLALNPNFNPPPVPPVLLPAPPPIPPTQNL